jgi:predicted ATPase
LAQQDDTLQTIVNHLTEFVRTGGRMPGARIAAELALRFPAVTVQGLGFTSFTDMLDRAASELSIVGRSGMDYVWSTDADLDRIEAAPDAEDTALAAESLHLTRFSAERFKSLAAVDVPLRSFNVLVGANGAGKTSVLEGMFLLSQLRYKKPKTIFSGRRSLSKLATLGRSGPVRLRLEVGNDKAQFVEYIGEPRVDEPATHRVRLCHHGELHEHDYAHGRLTGMTPRELPLLRAFGQTTLLRLDAYQLARPWVSSSEHPTLRHDGGGLPAVLANLAAVNHERLEEIFDATRKIIPAFRTARMPRQRVPAPRGRAEDDEEIGNGLELELYGRWLDANLASEGTLLVLGLMTIVHGLSPTRLLLMDDIERALHPKAQRALAEQLAVMLATKPDLQLVCTTHSPYLLDGIDPEDILVVRASPDDGLTRCRRLVEHQAWEKWRRSMKPGEFWSHVGEDWLEAE